MSGEETIRGHMFLTSDAAGQELCLRPEYTIPVCLAYLSSGRAGSEASFSYLGPVFRTSPDSANEFIQGGLESFRAVRPRRGRCGDIDPGARGRHGGRRACG